MKNTTLKFWVQANEYGVAKNVPHSGEDNYLFVDRVKAKEFLFLLRKNNPDTIFRLVTLKEEYIFGTWYSLSDKNKYNK